MQAEVLLLDAAVWTYLAAAALSLILMRTGRAGPRAVLPLLFLALVMHGTSIGLRWLRLGHGPYVDLFEILSSNVWSLHFLLALLCTLHRALRPALPASLVVLSVLVLWLAATPESITLPPVTYETIWLPIHMILGKFFLGLIVVAVGLSFAALLAFAPPSEAASEKAGPELATELEGNAHALVLIAAVFQSLMLIAGAAWARDAWGRYWAWDPLESWAFLSWLATLAYLHWRPRTKHAIRLNALLVVGIYVLAFATFFGVPFLSAAPHKGAI